MRTAHTQFNHRNKKDMTENKKLIPMTTKFWFNINYRILDSINPTRSQESARLSLKFHVNKHTHVRSVS
jgi:hypothetical protein